LSLLRCISLKVVKIDFDCMIPRWPKYARDYEGLSGGVVDAV